jgi:hypothetical protein
MDMEYMQSPFHQTHYLYFHKALPSFLRSVIHDEIIKGAREGIGNQLLVGFWRGVAKQVCGLSADDALPRQLEMTRDDFTMTVMRPTPEMTLLLMTGPAPRGALEVGCAVAVFEDADPVGTMRYFTSEAPTEPSFPWMVGEWFIDGRRANLGGLSDISARGMYNFVMRHMGIATDLPVPPSPVAASSPTSKGRRRLSFSANWSSSPTQLANETLENLYRLRTEGGVALVMNAKKTRGLLKKTSTYVQFMWNEDGSLIVEIQGDYSYWNTSVPSEQWPTLQAAGLITPSADSGNFGLVIPPSASMQEQAKTLTGVFQAFVSVLQPDGKIVESSF